MSSRRSRSGGTDREGGDTVVEIGAEAAAIDLREQIAIRRRDHPEIDLARRRLAEPGHLTLLEHP